MRWWRKSGAASCGKPGSPTGREPDSTEELVGNWYRIVDEIEKSGCRHQLVHAGKAKLVLGMVNRTDKLDARVLSPWCGTRLGNRGKCGSFPGRGCAGKGLAKYGVEVPVSDPFGVEGRELLGNSFCRLK